jgi:hypothetical protein
MHLIPMKLTLQRQDLNTNYRRFTISSLLFSSLLDNAVSIETVLRRMVRLVKVGQSVE